MFGAPGGDGSGGGSGGGTPYTSPSIDDRDREKTKTFTMKPDLSYFPTLNDDAKYPSWKRKFQAVCNGTNLGEVLDFDYRPQAHERESFRNKCMWVTASETRFKISSSRDKGYCLIVSASPFASFSMTFRRLVPLTNFIT